MHAWCLIKTHGQQSWQSTRLTFLTWVLQHNINQLGTHVLVMAIILMFCRRSVCVGSDHTSDVDWATAHTLHGYIISMLCVGMGTSHLNETIIGVQKTTETYQNVVKCVEQCILSWICETHALNWSADQSRPILEQIKLAPGTMHG